MGSVLYTNQQAKFERKKGKKKLAISSNKLAASSMEASTPVLSSNLDSRWQVATSRTREQEGHGGCRCSRLGFWASVDSVRIGAGATFARSLPALFELGCAVAAGFNAAWDSPPISGGAVGAKLNAPAVSSSRGREQGRLRAMAAAAGVFAFERARERPRKLVAVFSF